jgi:hypothetical protein
MLKYVRRIFSRRGDDTIIFIDILNKKLKEIKSGFVVGLAHSPPTRFAYVHE